MITASQLKERGWTPALVRTFLGEPDEMKCNPYYRSASPMRLYDINRVEEAEQTDEWKQSQSKAALRSVARKQAAQRQAIKLLSQAELIPIAVTRLSLDNLLKRAIASYNAFHEQLLWERGHDYEPASEQSDEAFLERITVNYVRHNLTEYDRHLEEIIGQVGVSQATMIIRKRIYDAIANTYPELADECRRQMHDRYGEVEIKA